MFYVKEHITDGTEISVEITDENVFCHCPVCRREVTVNLQDVLADGESDLMSTVVMCEECADEWMNNHGKKSNT